MAPYSTITISTNASGEWADNELTGAVESLEQLGVSVGEFWWLRLDLDRSLSRQREQLKIHLAKTAVLEASCVSFALKPEGEKPFNPVAEEN